MPTLYHEVLTEACGWFRAPRARWYAKELGYMEDRTIPRARQGGTEKVSSPTWVEFFKFVNSRRWPAHG